MLKDQVKHVLTQVSEEKYFPAIEYLNNLFLYKNKSLQKVFVLSQKLCDDYIEGTIEKREISKEYLYKFNKPEKEKTPEEKKLEKQFTEKEIITYKNLNLVQKKALAEKVLQDNSETFVQVLGADVDALSRLTLEQIGSKYLFSLWSMAEKTLRRRKSRRTKFKKERLQKQYVQTLNHGQFHLATLYRAKLKKVCTVKYTLAPKEITYDKYFYTHTSCWGTGRVMWHASCEGQGMGHQCGWCCGKTQRRCCRCSYTPIHHEVKETFENYECKNISYWVVEMQQHNCWYYRDEFFDYYNLCEIHNGKYFPVKKIKEPSVRMTDEKYYDRTRTKILHPDPQSYYSDQYLPSGDYQSGENGLPNLNDANNPTTYCPDLCSLNTKYVVDFTTKIKHSYKLKTHDYTENNQRTFQPRACWETQKLY